MMKKALIFGGNGQDGIILTNYLKQNSYFVENTSKNISDAVNKSIDVSNAESVFRIIQKTEPDEIYHFAAISNISQDFALSNFSAINNGLLNILEAVRQLSINPKIFFPSSALIYKNRNRPIRIHDDFDYSNIYNLCRIQGIELCRYYRKHCGLKIYVGHLFHHDSIHRSQDHINIKILNHAKKIANGMKDILELKNYYDRKEFNTAEEIVKSIHLFISQEIVFEALIGSGKHYSIHDWIQKIGEVYNIPLLDYIKSRGSYKERKVIVSDPIFLRENSILPNGDIHLLLDKLTT